MSTTLAVIALILLRLALPLAVLILFTWLAHRLDERWQARAERAPKMGIEEPAIHDVKHPAQV